MPEQYVYITTNEETYSVRCRGTAQEFMDDLELTAKVGFKLVKSYMISEKNISPTLDACNQFTEGEFSLDDLDAQITSLRK